MTTEERLAKAIGLIDKLIGMVEADIRLLNDFALRDSRLIENIGNMSKCVKVSKALRDSIR